MAKEEAETRLPRFETIGVRLHNHVAHIFLNRTDVDNAMNSLLLRELHDVVRLFAKHPPTRAITFRGIGKCFSNGMDLKERSPATVINEIVANGDLDVSRKGRGIEKTIREAQMVFSAIEECPKPTIVALHGNCRGAALDFASACDIRLASSEATFSLKFYGVDYGAITRLQKICSNEAWIFHHVANLSKFDADDALQHDFVLRLFDTPAEMFDGMTKLAEQIASRSPVAVQGVKLVLNHAKDHSVRDSLRFTADLAQSQNLNKDIGQATLKVLQKTTGALVYENI
ncbi:hypothetical protein QR680_007790 [Steinernema hermaphroditum]|uniref:3-hydroxyisobutyryl-coenzyme A hydrolase n=1 Tax=Steinernema hermaphroditum TaxID=289476 RepID=A0AA39M6Y7_9BILA|nr:hypothetical protein QR680_007790 [Steinernema hermaphroditum]